jgi:hypothetical protein
MYFRVTLIAAVTLLVAAPAVAMAGVGLAYADPNQTCTAPVWVTDMGVPIGSRTTCYNPDGSYQVCTSLGTAGNGPGTCINYPAAPAPKKHPGLPKPPKAK